MGSYIFPISFSLLQCTFFFTFFSFKIPNCLLFRKEKKTKKMEQSNGQTSLESMRKWVVEHKLRAVGSLWLTGIGTSIAYNWTRASMKPSVKIIHARLHAQALTLAALAGAAAVEYYDHHHSGSNSSAEQYAN
ncbi:hypothetical protein LUZ63_007885 [Rhynchospora breviuscula]|uniref:HIG1 domain-containing protein n=1 Tax=Rhynchospora breviuscula TaxID=2022672 RepID=A0A9Q0HVG9_9POAL|nr:hypothetical protein LUZ63_007885 [Rhynchospora breviuscula]